MAQHYYRLLVNDSNCIGELQATEGRVCVTEGSDSESRVVSAQRTLSHDQGSHHKSASYCAALGWFDCENPSKFRTYPTELIAP